MQINLSEFISNEHKTETFSVPVTLESFVMSGVHYNFIKRDPVSITVSGKGKNIVEIFGHMDMILDVPCSRCLVSVPTSISEDFCQELDWNKIKSGEMEDQDGYDFIEESSLDVDRFVQGEILIHFPVKPLCKDDCKGLCIRCGADLNQGECGCNRESLDPRMSAIRDIFNNFKEV